MLIIFSGGIQIEFMVSYDGLNESSVNITIDTVVLMNIKIVLVTLTIEQLSSCASETDTIILPWGPMIGMDIFRCSNCSVFVLFII